MANRNPVSTMRAKPDGTMGRLVAAMGVAVFIAAVAFYMSRDRAADGIDVPKSSSNLQQPSAPSLTPSPLIPLPPGVTQPPVRL